MSNITFKYIFPDDYNPVFVNGAWGGVTPSGELAISFYLERLGLPIKETHELTDEGKLGQIINREPEDQVAVRYIQNGIILTLDGAMTIYDWLGKKIKEAEKIKEDINKSKK